MVSRTPLKEHYSVGGGTERQALEAAGYCAELSELLDEGSDRAGFHLTRRAVEKGDLRELQRISDAGYDQAGTELERILKAPVED